jgi:thiamine-monophosphate kinase
MPPPSEDRLLRWLAARRETAGLIGDDGAILPCRGPVVVTVDAQREDVHFPAGLDPALIARRLLAVNLSDLAAMGAWPVWAFLTLSAPRTFAHRKFFDSLLRAGAALGLTLAGGDLSSTPQVATTLTLIGRKEPGSRWLKRSGGTAGERLWIGGSLGESFVGRSLIERGARVERARSQPGRRVILPADLRLRGALARAAKRAVLRHLLPEPQLELGRWLARQRTGGAIDVSDGLGIDLHRLCRASGVGCDVAAPALPLPPLLGELLHRLGSRLGATDCALAGGEDYVLLFSLPSEVEPPRRYNCYPIGRLRRGRRLRLTDELGKKAILRPTGWDHLSISGGGW